MEALEKRMKALEFFKDWSNYMLVTTVAALGWVVSSEKGAVLPASAFGKATIAFLALSTVFAIFTLALIPVVAETIDGSGTFYDERGQFRWFWAAGSPKKRRITLKWVCWPQHLFFVLGVLSYAVGALSLPRKPTGTTDMHVSSYQIFGWSYPADAWEAWFTLGLVITGIVGAAVVAWQSFLLRQQVRVARQEFIATHRPKLVIRQISNLGTFERDNMTWMNVECMIANVGDSDGDMIDSSYGIEFSEGKEFGPFPTAPFNKHKFQPGGQLLTRIVSVMDDAAAAGLAHLEESKGSSGRTLYFRGSLLYADSNGVARRTFFLRRYDYASKRFWPTMDPDYDEAD